MHGEEGENRKPTSRHMWPVPSRSATTTTTNVAIDSTVSASASYLFKDGRKINIGDCALFKPPQDSPPFIGIIRLITSNKESNSKLAVNWLYRPTEVKLGKGVILEAAPNEVFYSFHRDEIPAASLLHPCKVSFLPKGVELPSGISSFVCRRVYDITSKCLWWLTDQDYINGRQEEIDKLLRKTRLQLHATLQKKQGARSPKPVNGPAATSPLKHTPDSMKNTITTSPQARGKKRERVDQFNEPVKRERNLRVDDRDSSYLRSESRLKIEISKITEKGGLVDFEAVARLVQLMQLERSQKKIDLSGRSMLAGIIAATDKLEFLSQFVQLRGLPVLDEWLQEVHKGKIGDASKHKDDDKSVEDFLFVLLRALDKLPVNLNALQMCNIGKSVNHLRSHKNPEIQKKARSLVDTWKKRVAAEMNINDAKSGSSQVVPWPARSRQEGSHGGYRHPSSSSEAAMRSSVTQLSSSKSASVRLIQGDTAKSATASLGVQRCVSSPVSTSANSNNDQSRMPVDGSGSEIPQVAARDEKSSSSSQSHTNSQCSSDHVKILAPSRKDARSSTAGSKVLKSGSGSKHRKAFNGHQGTSSSHANIECVSSRNSALGRPLASDKASQSTNTLDASVTESNNHKLIVKIPNHGHGPAPNINGVCMEESSCGNSQASSPSVPEKLDKSDGNLKDKGDAYQCTKSDGLPASFHPKTGTDTAKSPHISNTVCLTSETEMRSRKMVDSSIRSIDALIESCVKFSDANGSILMGDDVGMTLLASVATGEISGSGVVSPAVSPQRSSAAAENSGADRDQKKSCCEDFCKRQNQPDGVGGACTENHNVFAGSLLSDEGEPSKHSSSDTEGLQQGKPCLRSKRKLDELVDVATVFMSSVCAVEKSSGGGGTQQLHEKQAVVKDESQDQLPGTSQGLGSSLAVDYQVRDASASEVAEERASGRISPCPPSVAEDESTNDSHGMKSNITEHKLPPSTMILEPDHMSEKHATVAVGARKNLISDDFHQVKAEKINEIDNHDTVEGENKGKDQEKVTGLKLLKQEESGLSSAVSDQKIDCKDAILESKVVLSQSSNGAIQMSNSSITADEKQSQFSSNNSKVTAIGGEGRRNCASITENAASLPTLGPSAIDVKLEFDLNKGFTVDDGKNVEQINKKAAQCPPPVVSPLQFSVSSASSSLPASITVTAAAKGPFLPPDDLLRNKRELGWKGSAATSAFRPAEPRKVSEMPVALGKAPDLDATTCKQGWPLLDIDLNVADETILQDIDCQNSIDQSSSKNVCTGASVAAASLRCSGGFDLDLNRVDEVPDLGQHLTSNSQRFVASASSSQPSSSPFSNGEANSRRDFDLNDGPAIDESTVEPSSYNQQHSRSIVPPQPSFGLRMNNSEIGSRSSWCPPGISYSAITTPLPLPDRLEQSFPIVGIGGGPPKILNVPSTSMSFSPDLYRGSVLSSSRPVALPSATFQYPIFSYGSSFPLPTSAMSSSASSYLDPTSGGRLSTPATPSQLLGTVPYQYPHAYVVTRPILDVSSNGAVESSQKWSRQGLDLNSGPGGRDAEGRDEILPRVSRPPSAFGLQSSVNEQARMYNVAGGVLQRKDPEGGWNSDRLSFKQPSWQ